MKTQKFFQLLILILVLIFSSTELVSQSVTKVGITSAQFLRIPVGARATAMGSASAASVNDASAMFWNPGALTRTAGTQVHAEMADWFLDMTHNYLAGSLKLDHGGVIGFNVLSLDMGDFEETTYDFPEGTGRTFGANSFAVGLAYAQNLLPDLSVGANVKYVTERIFNTSSGTVAFDVGTWYETPFYGIKFGVAVTNVGGKTMMDGDDLILPGDLDPDNTGEYRPDTKLATGEFDLPLNLRVGFYWDKIKTEQFSLNLAIDANSPADNVQYLDMGAEIGLLGDKIFLRGGLPNVGLDDRVYEWTAGFGFDYQLQGFGLQFGYAYQSHKYLTDINRFTFALQF